MMNTTNLFIEILIIGIGTFAVVAVFTAGTSMDILAMSRALVADFGNAVLIGLPFLVYFLGILIDRLADALLAKRESRIRNTVIHDPEMPAWNSHQDVKLAKTQIYVKSPIVTQFLEYNRSKLRICRGWVLNAALLFIGTAKYGIYHGTFQSGAWWSVLLCIAAIGALSFWAWRRMVREEYRKIYTYAQHLT